MGEGRGRPGVRARREGGMERARRNERALKRKRGVITQAPCPDFLCNGDMLKISYLYK